MAEKKLEPVTEKRSVFYEVMRRVVIFFFHTFMPVRFHNRERLDQAPPYLMIANHRHALDPVVMAMGIPKHQIVFLASLLIPQADPEHQKAQSQAYQQSDGRIGKDHPGTIFHNSVP